MLSMMDVLKLAAVNVALQAVLKKLELANTDAEKKRLEKRKKDLEKMLGKKINKHLKRKMSSGMTLLQVINRDMNRHKIDKRNITQNKSYKFSPN